MDTQPANLLLSTALSRCSAIAAQCWLPIVVISVSSFGGCTTDEIQRRESGCRPIDPIEITPAAVPIQYSGTEPQYDKRCLRRCPDISSDAQGPVSTGVVPIAFWQHDPPSPSLDSVEGIPSDSPMTSAPATQIGPDSFRIPLQGGALGGTEQLPSKGPMVTLAVRDAPLHSVLSLLAQQQGLSVVASSELKTPVTVTLQPMTLENALDAILMVNGCTWTRINDVIYVTPLAKNGERDSAENFVAQGREVRVFGLDYVAATDIEKVVAGLLSPVGKVFTKQVDARDKRKAIEQLVVEDLPPYLTRIASYVAQADEPPRQVMVEARILQVKLESDKRHGVNLDALARVAGADVTFKTQAFAASAGPAAILTLDGTDFNSLLDCLTATTDSKTLAAPKLLMINGQESKIQIGRRLGYFVTTTTQTSTLQDVQFLEVGVVLTVTPQISVDGQVVMKVRPKVSSGDINPITTLPEEDTTEVDTSIMVPDGHGVIIGGLIQETDNERQSKTPFLGDIWLLGRMFQRRTIERERSEVVVALLPTIVPVGYCPTSTEELELQRVTTPLVTPSLQKARRPWEPRLPDAIRNPIWPRTRVAR